MGAMVLRFADKKGHINFDDFICCTVKLKHMIGELMVVEVSPDGFNSVLDYLALLTKYF